MTEELVSHSRPAHYRGASEPFPPRPLPVEYPTEGPQSTEDVQPPLGLIIANQMAFHPQSLSLLDLHGPMVVYAIELH